MSEPQDNQRPGNPGGKGADRHASTGPMNPGGGARLPGGANPADPTRIGAAGGPSAGAGGGGGAGGRGSSGEFFNWDLPPNDPDPKRIGNYRIHHRLGSGGMGLVYLATRDDDQFNKRVAIKVIKKGMDSEAIISRFEQERQVLAALNHPNIARLLDGGLTEDGRPYFVMEHVEGLPIDDFCDNNRLPIEDRLKLFRTLCQAVHHAHQNLIVHRDLKPGNVIVSPDGTLKLLDFGIAKLLNPSLAIFGSEPTQTALHIMTPEYASPEQVRGDPISTSSDVYSLGVLLYELITGRRPFEFKTRLQNEIERIICNEDPEKPSTAITHGVLPLPGTPGTPAMPADAVRKSPTRATTVEEIAKVRDARPDRLRRQIAGDIDNMILMAMRKEPRRRYASAEQFAEDIDRHLTGLPVIAAPATWNYQFGKFVNRNKGGVAAVVTIIAVLIGGIIAVWLQKREADRQRDAARVAQEQALQSQRETEEIGRFTAQSLFSLNAELSRIPGSTDERDNVLRTAGEYVSEFINRVGSRADLRPELANGYTAIGDVKAGLRSNNLGDVNEAKKNYDKAANIWKSILAENPNDPDAQLKMALLNVRMGDLHVKYNEIDPALVMYQQAVTQIETLAASQPKQMAIKDGLATALLSLSDLYARKNDSAHADPPFRRSLQLRREIFAAQPSAAAERKLTVGLVRQADALKSAGKFQEALVNDQETLDIRRRLWDADQKNTQRTRDLANAHFFIATTLRALKRWDDATNHLNKSIEFSTALAESDPANMRYRIDCGLFHKELADTIFDQAMKEANRNANGSLEMPDADEAAALQAYAKASVYLEEPARTERRAKAHLAGVYHNWGSLEHNINVPTSRGHLLKARELYLDADPARTDTAIAASVQELDNLLGAAASQPGNH